MLLLTATVLGAVEVGAWTAPDCSPARLQALAAAEGAAAVRVSAQQRGGALVGAVEVAGARKRTFEAPSCEALLDALAVGVKLASAAAVHHAPAVPPAHAPRRRQAKAAVTAAVPPPPPPNPAARVAARAPPPPPALAPAVAAEAPPPPQAPAPAVAAERLPAPTAAVAAETAEPARPPRQPLRLEVGARGAIVLAPAPAPAFGGEVSFALLPGAGAAIELAFLHARTADLPLGPGRGRFSLTAGRLSGCSPALSLFRLSLAACGSVAVGAVWAQGLTAGSITRGYEVVLPWVDLGLAGRLSLALPAGLSLDARAGPTFPLSRHAFVFEQPQVAVHQVGAVGFQGTLGAAFAW